MEKTIRIIVKGHVQGVFFRVTAKTVAEKLGIGGTVKNNADRSVEMILTAREDRLDLFIAWCHQGPPRSRVETVEVSQLADQHFSDFRITK
ncbi:MAG: acylphosphatase [Terrimonas sp.]|nr:acylphosphatase [Terrimonas sp.]